MKAENTQNTDSDININLDVKIPKKRGRKPKNKSLLLENNTDTNNTDTNNTNEIKPKKRGRKPKNANAVVEVKIPKKRGRKPNILNTVGNNKIVSNTQQIKDNILHLKVRSDEIDENMITDNIYKYNPELNTPMPYEPLNNNSEPLFLKTENKDMDLPQDVNEMDNNYISINNPNDKDTINNNLFNNIVKDDIIENEEPPRVEKIQEVNSIESNNIGMNSKKKNIKPIMFYYNEFNKRKEWPSISNIKCLWCCHNFDCQPCAIPIKLKHGTFYVFGNFCSKECAASYNFDTNEPKNTVWERYVLLNYLYSIIEDEPNLTIKLAPSRLTLEIFGGYLDIKEFRNTESNKEYNIVYPPMVSVIPSVEEKYKDKLKRKETYYIPLDKERIKKANNDLRLKRKKPVSNKNTLENCMRLKYN